MAQQGAVAGSWKMARGGAGGQEEENKTKPTRPSKAGVEDVQLSMCGVVKPIEEGAVAGRSSGNVAILAPARLTTSTKINSRLLFHMQAQRVGSSLNKMITSRRQVRVHGYVPIPSEVEQSSPTRSPGTGG